MVDYKEITEGKIMLNVPVSDIPEHARKFGFYNPEMRIDRDFSVCCLAAFAKMFEKRMSQKPVACDLLSATGARAIRYAKEIGIHAIANDSNENAIELASENAKLNGVEIDISNKDGNLLLAERGFDIIDIDPFGSPYPFIDSAARSATEFSMVCVTATDTAVLFGTYPDVCEKRYGISGLKCDFFRELGTRILLSFVIREFAKYDKAFAPMICYSRRHYVRLVGIVSNGAEKTHELIEKFDWLSVGKDSWKTGKAALSGNGKMVGKIYLGPMKDAEFCLAAIGQAKELGIESELLLEIRNELDSLFYFDFQEISKKFKSAIDLDEFVFTLARAGFSVSRTPFCESGFRTNASQEDVESLFSSNKFA